MEYNRCPWSIETETMMKYHDEVWGIPEHDDQKLFAKLCLDIMQAGLSWRTILNKQENFFIAFDNFHIKTVACYDEKKYELLMQDKGIVRNRLKIIKEYGSFNKYIWNFTDFRIINNNWENMVEIPTSTLLSDSISNDMKKRGFKFVGSTIIYAFLQAVGIVNDHLIWCQFK